MALGEATRKEIHLAIQEAFSNIEIPPPDKCAVENKRLEILERLVQSHDKFIDGNGSQGAKTSIPLMDEKLQKLTKDFYEFRDKIEGRTWAIILLVLGTLITSVLNLVLQ